MFGSATSTGPMRYWYGGGTCKIAPFPQVDEPTDLLEWLNTPEARRLEGQWVLLSNEYDVVDHDHSPSKLHERHPNHRAPIIVFVDPRDQIFIGSQTR